MMHCSDAPAHTPISPTLFRPPMLRLLILTLISAVFAGGCSTQHSILATPPGMAPKTTHKPHPPKEPPPPTPRRNPPRDCRDFGEPAGPYQLAMFRLINDYRNRKGLTRLRYSRTLELAANRYAKKMHREDFFSHNAPDGSVPGDRAVDAGYCDPIVGENIAYGMNKMGSAAEAMMSFMDSPHHDENMRLKRWRYAGIGFFKVNSHRGTEYWWVQLFGMDVPKNAILPTRKKPGSRKRTQTR